MGSTEPRSRISRTTEREGGARRAAGAGQDRDPWRRPFFFRGLGAETCHVFSYYTVYSCYLEPVVVPKPSCPRMAGGRRPRASGRTPVYRRAKAGRDVSGSTTQSLAYP